MVSRVCMTEGDDRTCLIGALCKLWSETWIRERGVQVHGIPSLEVRSTREAARLAARAKVERSSKRSASSSSSASEGNAVMKRPWPRRKAGRGNGSRYGKTEGDDSTRGGCCGPDSASTFAGRVEGLSESDSPGKIGGVESHSNRNVPLAMIELASATTWQKDIIAKQEEYARLEIPKYMVVHGKGMRDGPEGCVTVGSLEPTSGQAVDVVVPSGMKDAEAQRFCQGTRVTGVEMF